MSEYITIQEPVFNTAAFYDEPVLSTTVAAATAYAIGTTQTVYQTVSTVPTVRFNGDLNVRLSGSTVSLYAGASGTWVFMTSGTVA